MTSSAGKTLTAAAVLGLVLFGAFWLKGGARAPLSQGPAESPPNAPAADSTAAGARQISQASDSPAKTEAAPGATTATVEEVRQDKLAGQILDSHNDNDPRLDTELRKIPPGARALMRDRYQKLAPEKRNERGTLVFLLGRNLENESDLKFMSDVVAEPACRSLGDCSKDVNEGVTAEDFHHEDATEISLAYPQLTALKMLERALNEHGPEWPMRAKTIAALREAEKSPITRVATMARGLAERADARN